jgi:hypothetical protein
MVPLAAPTPSPLMLPWRRGGDSDMQGPGQRSGGGRESGRGALAGAGRGRGGVAVGVANAGPAPAAGAVRGLLVCEAAEGAESRASQPARPARPGVYGATPLRQLAGPTPRPEPVPPPGNRAGGPAFRERLEARSQGKGDTWVLRNGGSGYGVSVSLAGGRGTRLLGSWTDRGSGNLDARVWCVWTPGWGSWGSSGDRERPGHLILEEGPT